MHTNEYQAKQAEAKKLLAEIQKLIAQDAKDQKKNPNDWGYVGSMGHVVELLEQVKESLKD